MVSLLGRIVPECAGIYLMRMRMSEIAVSVGAGTISSLLAAYLFRRAETIEIPWWWIVGFAVLVSVLILTLISQRYRFYVITSSGITGYYPKGQKSYISDVIRDITAANKIQIIGARGLDLVGDQSPIGKALRSLGGNKIIEVFLLGAESEHGRLRSNYLEIERRKYVAESISAQHAVLLLNTMGHDAHLYTYDASPKIRAIIADDVAYVSSYKSGTRGRRLPAYRISSRRGAAFEVVAAYIEYLRSISACQQEESESSSLGEAS